MPRKKQPKPASDLPPALIRKVMKAMGRKGGQVRGISKARTSDQARAAVNVRWEKERSKKMDLPPNVQYHHRPRWLVKKCNDYLAAKGKSRCSIPSEAIQESMRLAGSWGFDDHSGSIKREGLLRHWFTMPYGDPESVLRQEAQRWADEIGITLVSPVSAPGWWGEGTLLFEFAP
jgi:hypothetical protein